MRSSVDGKHFRKGAARDSSSLPNLFSVNGGEKLNYKSVRCCLLLRKSQNLLFLAPEVQWALKFAVFVRFTFP